MTPEQIKLAIKVVIVVAVFGAGWTVRGWHAKAKYDALVLQHTQDKNAELEAEKTATRKALEERDALSNQLIDADQRYYHDLTEARKTSDKRRSDLAANRVRPTVPATCPRSSSTPGNLDDGATERAVIDGHAGQDIYAVGQYCDEQVTKLRALQDYVTTLLPKCTVEGVSQ